MLTLIPKLIILAFSLIPTFDTDTNSYTILVCLIAFESIVHVFRSYHIALLGYLSSFLYQKYPNYSLVVGLFTSITMVCMLLESQKEIYVTDYLIPVIIYLFFHHLSLTQH